MSMSFASSSFRRAAAFGVIALLLSACATTAPTEAEVDVLIRGGTIYDGSDATPFVGDVAIRGDTIVQVGDLRRLSAARVVDAQGMIVAPGFIDPHTHADGFLRSSDPAQRVNPAWLNQAVTTVVIGVDGSGTPDVASDARRIETSGVGTNFISLVGFGAVRQRVLGQAARARCSAAGGPPTRAGSKRPATRAAPSPACCPTSAPSGRALPWSFSLSCSTPCSAWPDPI